MEGTPHAPGIMQLGMELLFEKVNLRSQASVQVSLLEIYNEEVPESSRACSFHCSQKVHRKQPPFGGCSILTAPLTPLYNAPLLVHNLIVRSWQARA